MNKSWIMAVALAGLFSIAGCASYVTPGGGVSLTSLSGADADIASRMKREPSVPFPARMAVVRVQASGYRSNSSESYGEGKYSVVTARDIEQDADWARLEKLPRVAGVALLNKMVIPSNLQTDHELRLASASLKADLLLAYSIDTTFRVDEHDVGPLRLISLGMLPTKQAKVTATCSAALFDVRTGYVYGLDEATAMESQIASSWTSRDAVDKARHKAERSAFEGLLANFEKTWGKIVLENDHVASASIKPDR